MPLNYSWFQATFGKLEPGTGQDHVEIIRFYQKLGFLPGTSPARLIRRFVQIYRRGPLLALPWDEVYILGFDRRNTWAFDAECDLWFGSRSYRSMFRRCARISRGAFRPKNVREHWKSEEGPVTVQFRLGQKDCIIAAEYMSDWIDVSILKQLNPFIVESGRQFECAIERNFTIVLCLTADQKKAIVDGRGVSFSW